MKNGTPGAFGRVSRPNGASQGIDVLCEITSIGEAFGFAETTETIGPVEAGQMVYLPFKTCQVLNGDRRGAWGVGSAVVIALLPNQEEEHRAETPWVGVFAKLTHPRNKRVAPPVVDTGGAAAQIAERLLEETQALVQAWVEVDPDQGDRIARKAAEDIVSAAKQGDLQGVRSALGRLKARVTELSAPAATSAKLRELGEAFAALLGGSGETAEET